MVSVCCHRNPQSCLKSNTKLFLFFLVSYVIMSDSLYFIFLQVWCAWSPAAQWWSLSCFCVPRQVWHLYLSSGLRSAFPAGWFISLTLSAVNPQSLISPPPYLVYLSIFTLPLVRAERRYIWPQILVGGSRVGDLSASPFDLSGALVAWAKLMRRDNVDLMVLCIDYPSLLCCLVGVLLPSLFSCCWIHEY